MGSRFAAIVRVAVIATAGAVLAAGRAGAQEPPSFAAQAELVTVDAVVLGPDGKPVSGLTREDFVVKEDGRLQTVKAFEAIEAVVPALESPQSVPSSPSQARVATNVAGPPTRRTFAIVFDDLHVDEMNAERAKEAVAAFAQREVKPGDRLVLFTVSDARFWATTRGAQDPTWLEALRAVRSRRPRPEAVGCQVSHYEAMRIEDFNDGYVEALVQRRLERLCPEDRLLAEARQMIAAAGGAAAGPAAASGSSSTRPKIRGIYTQARTALGASLRVVRLVARSLGSTPGRKSLVLVTEGFPTDPSLPGFREVREEAARANVVIHFLDARGLTTGVPEFLSASGTTGVPPDRGDVAQTTALWRLEDAGAKTLAVETGGLVLQTNDLVSGLAQIADESRVTYLLGYEPTNEKRDGRYRALEVEVRRPGLQVRARAGYFAAKAKEKPSPLPSAEQRAFGNVFDADGIPLRLAAYVMGEAPVTSPSATSGREVLIAGELRLDALEAQVKGGRRVAEPRLKLLTGSRGGESHEAEWTLEVTLANDIGSGAAPEVPFAAGDARWHPFVTRIAMAPGDYRARLVVQSGGRLGSVTVDFVVPPLTQERLSTPILSDRVVPSGSDRRVLPLARRVFDAGTTLHCWVELAGAGVDPESGQSRAKAEFVVRTREGREWARGPALAMNLERGKPTRLVSVPLADAPEGEHELVLRVNDEVSGATFEAREPFRVERAGSSQAAASGTSVGPGEPQGAAAPEAIGALTVTTGVGAPPLPSGDSPGLVPEPPAVLQPSAPPAPAGTPSFRADTQVVLLDVVASDRQGRPVTDLRRNELQVFEDGKRCAIQSFRRVHGAPEAPAAASGAPAAASGAPAAASGGTPPATGSAKPATQSQAEASAPSRANLVVLLLQTLYDDKAANVRKAALDLVDRSFPPGTWFAVYQTDSRNTRLLQSFTSSRPRLRQAVLDATAGRTDRRTASEADRRSGDDVPATPVDAPAGLQSFAREARDLAESAERAEGAHFRGREEVATFLGIQEIVRSLSGVRGRKAVVYFAVDHELGGGEISGGRASEVYAAAMREANRANVTVHTVDASGLTCSRIGGRSAFDRACGVGAAGETAGGPTTSVSWTAATETATEEKGPLLGDPERVGSPAPERFLSSRSGSLLEHVAEETGGLAITKTNDPAAGLVRVIDELREYYEVVYTPPNFAFDGRFRRIEAKVGRRGVQVRTRAGYFASPETTPAIPRSSVR